MGVASVVGELGGVVGYAALSCMLLEVSSGGLDWLDRHEVGVEGAREGHLRILNQDLRFRVAAAHSEFALSAVSDSLLRFFDVRLVGKRLLFSHDVADPVEGRGLVVVMLLPNLVVFLQNLLNLLVVLYVLRGS